MIFLSNHYSNPFVTGGQYLLTKNPDFSHFWKINPSPPPSDLFLEILELPPGCDRRHGFLSETGNALFTLTQMWNRKWPLCVCIPIWNSSHALYTIKLQDGRNQRGMAMTLFALYSLLISSDRGIYSISEDDFFSSRCREHSYYCGCLPDMLTGQWNIYTGLSYVWEFHFVRAQWVTFIFSTITAPIKITPITSYYTKITFPGPSSGMTYIQCTSLFHL